MESMTLKFPNARLLIHAHVLNGLPPEAAIARSACEYGLIADEHVKEVELPEPGMCHSLSTVKNVLKVYFERRSQQGLLPLVDVEVVWASLMREVNLYRQAHNLPLLDNCANCSGSTENSKFVPALFDFMLQQIRRYS